MTDLRLRLFLTLLLRNFITYTTGRNFTVGLLISYSSTGSPIPDLFGWRYAQASFLAVEDVNNSTYLLPGHRLSLIWNDTKCDENLSLQALLYMIYVEKVDAVIGPPCSCHVVARIASVKNIPMISYLCNEPLYDSSKYSTFARTKVQIEVPKLSKGLAKLLKKFSWSQVAVLYENTSRVIAYKETVVQEFKRQGINIRLETPLLSHRCYVRLTMDFNCSNITTKERVPFMTEIVEKVKKQARIVLILGYYKVGLQFLTFAYDQGLADGDYAFIIVQLDQQQSVRQTHYHSVERHKDDNKMDKCKYFRAFQSVIVVEIKTTQVMNETLKVFQRRIVAEFNNSMFPVSSSKKISPVGQTIFVAAYLYDAIYQYAMALTETLERHEQPNGRNIIAKMLNSSYISKSGAKVFVDQNGTADVANLRILQLRWNRSVSNVNKCENNTLFAVEVGSINFTRFQENPEVSIEDDTKWPKGKPPSDSPPCGFDGEKCMSSTTSGKPTPSKSENIEIIIGGVTAAAGVIFIILLIIITRQYMLKRELDSLLWKINYRDISWARPFPLASSDECEDDPSDSKIRKTSTQFTFTNFGFYKGLKVTVKQVGTKTIDPTKNMLMELKQVLEINDRNRGMP